MSSLSLLYISEYFDRSEQHILKGMADLGQRIRVLTPQRNHTQLENLNAKIELIDIPLENRMDHASIKIIRQTINDRPDIIHCLRNNRPIANTIQALKKQPNPIPLIAYRGTSGHLSYWDPGSRLTYLHPRINHLIAVSNAVRSYLHSKRIPESKLTTIYKGHNPEWYTQAPPTDISNILGRAPHDFILGFAGRMRHVKAADLILKAASLVNNQSPMDFLLIGEIADPKIQKLADAYSGPHGIHLPGFRDDAPALIRSCDTFIMPTRDREGLPRAVIEAMCQGIPPIVTDVGGMPELVRHEQDGLVIPPNDLNALATAIDRMRNDTPFRKACGTSAQQRIKDTFNISNTVEKTLALYKTLL